MTDQDNTPDEEGWRDGDRAAARSRRLPFKGWLGPDLNLFQRALKLWCTAAQIMPDLSKVIDFQVRNPFRDMTKQLARMNAIHSAQIIAALGVSGIYKKLGADYGKLLSDLMPKLQLREWLDGLLDRVSPANWREVEEGLRLTDLVEMSRAGIPVAWVPRGAVLSAMIEADPADRLHVLANHQGEVLEDCQAVLAAVACGRYDEQMQLLGQAITALRSGLDGPAQAAACSVLDTVLKENGSYNYWRAVAATEDYELRRLRYYATMAPLGPALEQFKREKGDPVPAVFNRHATTHAACAIQYTPCNALVAAMLAVSVVRELHEQDAETAPDAGAA